MNDKKRLSPEVRREQVLTAALRVAAAKNYLHMTREEVATEAGCHPTLVSHYFGTMIQFRRDVMRAAIRAQDLTVIAQGLVVHDSHAMKAPEELRKKAAQSIAGA